MAERGLVVNGLAPLLRDLGRVSKTIQAELREELRQVAAPVAIDAKFREGQWGQRQAAGIRVRVRQRGVSVEQSLRRSPVVAKQRPNFGGLQMREALIPALHDNADAIERRAVDLVDKLLDGVGGAL